MHLKCRSYNDAVNIVQLGDAQSYPVNTTASMQLRIYMKALNILLLTHVNIKISAIHWNASIDPPSPVRIKIRMTYVYMQCITWNMHKTCITFDLL